jgi:6-phosphogluconate dehydrogenase
MSARHALRQEGAARLERTPPTGGGGQSPAGMVADARRRPFYAAKACSYAQGLGMLARASAENAGGGWTWGEIARIWKGGCIIPRPLPGPSSRRSSARDPGPAEPPLRPHLRREPWAARQDGVAPHGGPGGGERASRCRACPPPLSYYDALRRERLPANLTQAQRDFFGAHTFERLDRPGHFHHEWNQ